MIKQVSVIGTGTMGNGIAHVFALAGYQVSMVGVSKELTDKAFQTIVHNMERQEKKGLLTSGEKQRALENLHIYTDLREGVSEADLVVEAVPEDENVKQEVFQLLDKSTRDSAILASNTSSLAITRLASFTKKTDKVIGMHFMNPVPVMSLVEVIRGFNTSDETAGIINDVCLQLGKSPVQVNDYPGFVANRILMPMINEAIFALYENVAGVSEIDTVMKLGMAHPMGPLQLADFIGLDVCHSILMILYNDFRNPKYAPCPLLQKMIEANQLGVKTGHGFYQYGHGNKELIVSDHFRSR